MNLDKYLESIESDNCDRPAHGENFRYDRYDIANALAKKDEIIKELKRLYFYADIKNWQTPESQGFRVDDFCLGVADMIEEIDSRDSDYGGNLAREVKKKIEILENGK